MVSIIKILAAYNYSVEAITGFCGVPQGTRGEIIHAENNMILVKWDNGTCNDWFSRNSEKLIRIIPTTYFLPAGMKPEAPLVEIFINAEI